MANAIVEALEQAAKRIGKTLSQDASKAVEKLYNDTSQGVEKVVSNLRNADDDTVAHLHSHVEQLSTNDAGKLDSDIGRAASKAKFENILNPSNRAAGPMRADQEQSVRDALSRMKVSARDQTKIITALKSSKTPMGSEAAELIGRGDLEGSHGYTDVLSQFKEAQSRPAAMMSLRHGEDLLHRGSHDITFEDKAAEGQPHYDIDVGAKKADGSLSHGYQLKDVQTIKGLKSASDKAGRQLANAPAEHRVALMDVHEPLSGLDEGTKSLLGTRAGNHGVTYHLRFSDGKTLTIPPEGSVYPG